MITSVPDWQTKTDAEVLAYLLENEFVGTGTAVTLSHIKAILTTEAYALVRLTLEAATVPQSDSTEAKMMAAEMADAVAAMRSVGLSFSSLDRQAVIDMLAVAGTWPDAVRDAVKALGGVMRGRWVGMLIEELPTIESVAAMRLEQSKQAIVDTARTAINAKSTAINAWLDAVDLATYTEAELQTWVDGLLASADGNGGGE